jgi:DNA invertase Pin-like site-specific DNA recombinase
MTNRKNQAAIYMRLSRDDGGDAESNSISNQRDMLLQYAKTKGFAVKAEYIDDGWSGTSFERPGFKRMIEEIGAGKLGIVLCKDLSRLGRNNALVAYYTEIFFPDNDIQFIAVNDGIDTFCGENEIMGFKSVINEYYARDISKKIKSAKLTMSQKGLFVGAFAPYGYMKSPENKHLLIPDPEAAPVVRRIFRLAASGTGAGELVTILRRDKILTPSSYKCSKGMGPPGKFISSYSWSKSTVQSILRNHAYIGAVVWGKQAKKSFKAKTVVARPKENWVIVEGVHEPLVDVDAFGKVQALISIKRPKNVTDFDNIFRGLLRCSDCGVNMAYQNQQGRHTIGHYNCNAFRRHQRCTAHHISYTALYNLVLREVRAVIKIAKAYEEDLMQFVRTMCDNHSDEASKKERHGLARIDRRVGELDAIIKKLLEQNALGAISDQRFASLSVDYDAEQKTLAAQAETIRRQLQRQKGRDISAFYNIVRKYTEADKLTAPLLFDLIDRIVIFDGIGRGRTRTQRVEIYFKCASW